MWHRFGSKNIFMVRIGEVVSGTLRFNPWHKRQNYRAHLMSLAGDSLSYTKSKVMEEFRVMVVGRTQRLFHGEKMR